MASRVKASGFALTPLLAACVGAAACRGRHVSAIAEIDPDEGQTLPVDATPELTRRIDPRLEVQLWRVLHRDEFADTVGLVLARGGMRFGL